MPVRKKAGAKKLRYEAVEEAGYRFLFAYDKDAPELLHIFARHTTDIDDALDVFFDDEASQTHDEQHDRFERRNATHGLLWTWHTKGKVVLVISCWTEDNDDGEA